MSCLVGTDNWSHQLYRSAYAKAIKAAKIKLSEPIVSAPFSIQPLYARITPRQPINRIAAIRQGRRHFSTRRVIDSIRSEWLGNQTGYKAPSRVASNVSSFTRRAPFASTLRPSLTGGTLCRTAGGYAIGAGRIGGARYFSHGAAAPAQVINNVSAGMRAFFLSGSKVRFDGIDPRNGNKRFKTLSRLQNEAESKLDSLPKTAPGSSIDFQISPTVTAFGALGGVKFASADVCETKTLNSEGLMDLLSVDLARALKDLAAVLNDLKRLGTLGDLPILLHDKSTIRVRFPGCDAETVERLCDEVGVQRGRISQDEDFDILNGVDLALHFPFAPSAAASPEYYALDDIFEPQAPEQVDWRDMLSPSGGHETMESSACLRSSVELVPQDSALFGDNPWTESPSDYSSVNVSELGDRAFFPELSSSGISDSASDRGIHRFLADCDDVRRIC